MPTTPQPSGLVNLKVLANGSELSGEYQISSIDISKEINRISSATIIFIDGNPSKQEFTLSNNADLDPGNEIEIKSGYDTEAISIYKGMIVKHGVRIIGGSSFTSVECKDKAILMTIENCSEIYEKKKDSDIIKTLIQKYSGVTASVEATNFEHPQILQYDCTDWDFMLTRTEHNGKIITTIDNQVTIAAPVFNTAVLTLEFGTNILEFEADIDAQSQLSKVTANAWDIQNQAMTEQVVSSATFDDTGNLTFSTLANKVKKDGQSLFHGGPIDPNELTDWGTGIMLKSKMAKLRGRVKSKGVAAINPGETLELKGIGQKFNGNVYVSGVRQEIRSGYWFTHIQFGISPEQHMQKFNYNPKEAAGLIPAVHGLQIGIVQKIHEDPDSQYRIQVSLPVFGSQTLVWARQAFPDAGPERGLYFVPEINDEVVIGFFNDDARFPVILGSMHSIGHATPYTTDAENKEKGVRTREDLRLTFDDVDKIITIKTPAEQSIIIDDKNEEITITDKSKNKITMKSNLIELKGVGDIKIEAAQNIEIKGMKITTTAQTDVETSGVNIKNTASAQFEASANAKAEIKASGQAVLKGGGMVEIKGALVKIN